MLNRFYYIFLILFVILLLPDTVCTQIMVEVNPLVKVRILTPYHPQTMKIMPKSGYYSVLDGDTNQILFTLAYGERLSIGKDEDILWFYLESTNYIYRTNALILQPNDYANSQLNLQLNGLDIRSYRGGLYIDIENNELRIINEVPLEKYLCSVVACELVSDKMEAVKAQAIVARTFAYKNLGRHKAKGYDFCDLTHCQVYKGSSYEREYSIKAVESTSNEVITYKGEIAEAFYHSTCGGLTSEPLEIWGSSSYPYLISIADCSPSGKDYCSNSPHYRWGCYINDDEMYYALKQNDKTNPGDYLTSLEVFERGDSGRVTKVIIRGENTHIISGSKFRNSVCRVLGWGEIKSTDFDIQDSEYGYYFTGKGLGHGIGLCQWGAKSMAKEGYDAYQIIHFYFPRTKLEKIYE